MLLVPSSSLLCSSSTYHVMVMIIIMSCQVVSHEEMMVTKDIDSFLSGEEATGTSDAIGGLLHFPRRPSAHVR